MKKFITRLAIFSAPIGVVIILLLFVPVDKKYAYQYLKGDFSKAGWIYKRIYEKTDPVDVVFIGTSHTLNGVNDSLIERSLSTKMGEPVRVSNLSLNHPGANAEFAIFKDLLKNKKPKMLVLEVREVEARFSHFAFPIIADREDMLLPVVVPNVYLFRDYLYALQSRYGYLKHQINPEKEEVTEWTERSFGYQKNSKKITPEELRIQAQEKINSPMFYLGENFREIEFNLGKEYVKKIHQLALENNVKLVFLYLPYYGIQVDKPAEYDFYRKMGEVWFPPADILGAPQYWSDLYHVNDLAATRLAEWLSSKLLEHDHLLSKTQLLLSNAPDEK